MDEDNPLSSLTLYDPPSSSTSTSPSSSSPDTDAPSLRQQKLSQNESQFLLQKSSWRPQDDIALSHARLTLPLASSSPESLKIKAEQEYYLRRYADALSSAKEALRRMEREAEGAEGERRERRELRELRDLVGRCERREGGMGEGEGGKI